MIMNLIFFVARFWSHYVAIDRDRHSIWSSFIHGLASNIQQHECDRILHLASPALFLRNNFLLNSDLAETESSPGVSLSLKISQKSLVKLISDCPHVLRSEFLRKWIVPISDCVKFGLSSSAITSILEYSSRIGIGPEKKIEFLVGIGISRDNIERFFHIFPEILGIGTETRLKPLLDEFKKMGFGNDEMKKEIAIEPRVLC
ncbi:unnamed protein product [Microthlaspi erraticum]|uniref:Uncharacterized protein n=1 Tax=Microthlaspi erraticum TaxID=1685480 RepID=A0A6D2KTA5_9BRAS|nr:unnamed protein product [Microthlaspi erraticum]